MGHLLLAALLTGLAPTGLEAGMGLPSNLKGGPFQVALEQMWKGSATFRDQCARIARHRTLIVRLRAESGFWPESRARTDFFRHEGALLRADIIISISAARDQIELIGHELEHVVEQIEGVRTGESRCAARTNGTGALESCRAIEAGRRIAREVEEAGR